MKTIRIIGSASGLGAADRRCESGPEALRKFGVISHLRKVGLRISWESTLHPSGASGREEPLQLWETLASLSQQVVDTVFKGDPFVILGGDHSCAIGTWSGAAAAVRRLGPLGLIWIDAHMDCHTPQTSPSGLLHGMPLAALLGHGEHRFTHLAGHSPVLLPEHVALIGVRSYEAEESALLNHLGVRVFSMDEVEQHGLEAVMYKALEIALHRTVGFGVTIDLDAVDPGDCPGVGTPAPDGLPADELAAALRLVHAEPRLLGLEIAEYNPCLDQDFQTARVVQSLIASVFAGHAYEQGHKAGNQLLSA